MALLLMSHVHGYISVCIACGCLFIERTFECLIDSYVVVKLWVIDCVVATTVG